MNNIQCEFCEHEFDEEISRAWCDNMEVNKGWEQDDEEDN